MTAVLESVAPSFSVQEAQELALRRFGVAGTARLLTSERDQNFHLRAGDGQEYVLKIANAAEDVAVIAFQDEVLEHVVAVDAAAPTPRVVRTTDGQGSVVERGSIVRLLTWISGALMHQVARTPLLRTSLGAVHGRLTLAMRECAAVAPDQGLLWDMQEFPRLRKFVELVEAADLRAMLERTLDRFDAEAAAVLPELRVQIIHNDLNPHNVVVDESGSVSGVIDFGDMVRAPLICDVAVAAAYHVRPDGAPLVHVQDYVGAFHAACPLTREELALLPLLIQTRAAMSVLISNWRASRYPENRDYILRNAPTASAALRALSATKGLEIVT